RLAYVRNCDGNGDVIVRTLSTNEETTVKGLPAGAGYDYWQHALAWDPKGERLAISWTASRASPNIWIWSLDQSEAKQVTFAANVDATTLIEPEHVTYPTFDGKQIPALFYPARDK